MGSAVQRLTIIAGIVVAAVSCSSSHETVSGVNDDGKKLSGHSGKSKDSKSDDDDDTKDSDKSGDDKIATSTAAKVADDGTVTFSFDAKIPAGQEMFKCLYGQFPTDGVTAIYSAESHYTPGSHHMLAYRSDLTSVPDGQTGVWDCADGAWFRHQRGSYYEAQQPDESRTLPDGVAHKFQPGEVIIIQAHYINTTDDDIDAHVEFKLHTMDVDDVQEEAGTIYFNDTNILVPPHSKAGVTMTCPIPQDINLAFLWSHMHKRGIHFVVTTDDPAAQEKLGTLYEERDWAEPKPREYPVGEDGVIHAGSHITIACEFQNDGDEPFRFGNSAETNEMCILHGMYFPRMPVAAEQCIVGRMATRQLPPGTDTGASARPAQGNAPEGESDAPEGESDAPEDGDEPPPAD